MAGGRPTSYKDEYVTQGEKLALLGATDMQMADFFGVALSTLTLWKNTHPEFSVALKTGKDVLDTRVEQSLYHRAMGFERDSVKIFCSKDGEVTTVPFREQVPPDTVACIFWLKNRKQKEWRDRQDVNATGTIEVIKRVVSDL